MSFFYGEAGVRYWRTEAGKRRPMPIRYGPARCCVSTIREYHGPTAEGMTIRCRLCQAEMVVKDRAWEEA